MIDFFWVIDIDLNFVCYVVVVEIVLCFGKGYEDVCLIDVIVFG